MTLPPMLMQSENVAGKWVEKEKVAASDVCRSLDTEHLVFIKS